jgi:hypothetical protein
MYMATYPPWTMYWNLAIYCFRFFDKNFKLFGNFFFFFFSDLNLIEIIEFET